MKKVMDNIKQAMEDIEEKEVYRIRANTRENVDKLFKILPDKIKLSLIIYARFGAPFFDEGGSWRTIYDVLDIDDRLLRIKRNVNVEDIMKDFELMMKHG